ncbi:hypothetical protein K3495_g719 [Podosphaera aphanis]|nr:hypothetical protein K3495_g719 [Podosphaera aphanis]
MDKTTTVNGSVSTSSITTPTTPPAQSAQGITILTFFSALTTSLIVFAIQLIAFFLLRNKLARIFKPKTYLVPEKERTEPPPRTPWGWLFALFRFRDREVIRKCGLDAYFFSRYLQTLLVIFIPMAIVILPILLPINYVGGRGSSYREEVVNATNATNANETSAANVKGLDTLAWGNIRPTRTQRYWAHLTLAALVIIWVCTVFFLELRVYIRVRQEHLTSAEHRLRASATTVLVSAIPRKWLSEESLTRLYDVFPGGIRNIWINRNFDDLLEKIQHREYIYQLLEGAETELIQSAKKSQRKQADKDAKEAAKKAKYKLRMTNREKQQRLEIENAQAVQLAHSGGQSTGELPHSLDDAFVEEERKARRRYHHHPRRSLNLPGLVAFGQGLERGLGTVSKAGETVIGGARYVGRNLESQLETTNGFMSIEEFPLGDDNYDQRGCFRGESSAQNDRENETRNETSSQATSTARSEIATENPLQIPDIYPKDPKGDSVDHISRNSWWKFWKPPTGGYGTPYPVGYEARKNFPFPETEKRKNNLEYFKNECIAYFKSLCGKFLPFLGLEETQSEKYPVAYDPDFKQDAQGAAWEKYLKPKDRPTHRLPLFNWTPHWLPGLPLINKKVDTIYWCRKELARLNLEIEIDQKHPEKFPLMNSAFIQFNNQVAAHMASQSVSHHVPKQMAPRTVEVSPKDVLWENMSIKWWEAWFRTGVVIGVVISMVILWAFPVAWTASLAQMSTLIDKYSFLHWVRKIPMDVVQAISGVLPAIVLGVLLILVPMILKYLAFLQGAQTGTEQQGSVQIYYFVFLFVQVFLVVSISGGALAALGSATNITAIPDTLATQLPKAANYFFSYMILQALSTSSGGLLQIVTLLQWYIWPKIVDKTARDKWTRNTTLPSVTWGTKFPIYTNFACIALIYSIVAPLIIVFAIITFSMLWVAQRYNILYVSRFQLDTGGLLYPRAINQTFTGLYIMELCLVGLFFLVRDERGNQACVSQAIIMIVFIFLTAIYQVLLNKSFGPLLHHLPITFEKDAILRDEMFKREQARRLGLVDEESNHNLTRDDAAIRVKDTHTNNRTKSKTIHGAGLCPIKTGRNLKSTFSTCYRNDDIEEQAEDNAALNSETINNVPDERQRQRKRYRTLEAQRRIGDALYGGYNHDIEDLTPEQRDLLVKHAFQHSALRARRPTVWIPRDDIGVSDDEIKRTREFAGRNIWISNVGAALDGKSRVVYGRNPPDFSEVDLINL